MGFAVLPESSSHAGRSAKTLPNGAFHVVGFYTYRQRKSGDHTVPLEEGVAVLLVNCDGSSPFLMPVSSVYSCLPDLPAYSFNSLSALVVFGVYRRLFIFRSGPLSTFVDMYDIDNRKAGTTLLHQIQEPVVPKGADPLLKFPFFQTRPCKNNPCRAVSRFGHKLRTKPMQSSRKRGTFLTSSRSPT